jgi:Holliday junction resolvase RusA-like endonuclease
MAQVLLRDAVVRQNGGRLIEGPVRVTVAFYGADKRADLDNLIKSVLDAAQGSVFVNDKQVVSLSAAKHGAIVPHTAIEIVEQH